MCGRLNRLRTAASEDEYEGLQQEALQGQLQLPGEVRPKKRRVAVPEFVVGALVWDAMGWGTTFRFMREEAGLSLEIELRTPTDEPSVCATICRDASLVLEAWGDGLGALRLRTKCLPDTLEGRALRAEVQRRGGRILCSDHHRRALERPCSSPPHVSKRSSGQGRGVSEPRSRAGKPRSAASVVAEPGK